MYDEYRNEAIVPNPKSLRGNQYLHTEIELAAVLAEIWQNRIAIDSNDLFALRLFAEKRVSPDPAKLREAFKFRQLIVSEFSEDATAE
jgi:hypothetical protein